MGLWDKITKRGESSASGDSNAERTPSIDNPTHVVTYTDENGKPVVLQTYSAVAADQIKSQHPDAKIEPKRK